MNTITANTAKQNFGELIDQALKEPVSITKHGRPSVVVTSDSEYRELMALKYARLKTEVQSGFDQIDNRQVSKRTAEQIAASILEKHQSA